MTETADVEPPSAEVLLNVVLIERQQRLDSLTALDQRAGVFLGGVGTITALGTLLPRWWLQCLVYVVAAWAGRRCFRALRIDYLYGFDALVIRNDYLTKPALVTSRTILDLLAAKHDELTTTLRTKADRTRQAQTALLCLIAATAAAGLIGGRL